MKRTIFILVVAFTIMASSCKDKVTINPIVGGWEYVDDLNDITFLFTEEGQFTYANTELNVYETGTYEVMDDHVIIYLGYATLDYKFRIENNKLFIITEFSNAYEFIRFL